MNNIVKSQKGITLMALVVTIIILLIIAGIGIGEIAGNGGNINQTEDVMALSELKKVQQAVLETYIKYKQLGNENVLIGTRISWDIAQDELHAIKSGLELKTNGSQQSKEYGYYELNREHLNNIGLDNIHNDDKYIVNYSTGEVFNITQKKTAKGDILYVYAEDLRNQ